ncbi:hypothetical protein BLX24_10375 [Arsenicibacter rosenii]|uniref:Glycosyl hydrolase family 13 catalytic domain-containing protein n=2 Tax=Arsenicibacter rosenii TaxID=1750698 RepID=A0A1S2VKT3_9BACT|nr:hypothetical protein BLX24_10375 [Arsenicibacter rosenii]
MLQGFYWDYPKTGQGFNWSDTLRLKAQKLGQAGFTHVWYPPFAGNGNKSGGYDPKDLFIGNSQTSLGTLPQITAMVNSFTTNGITPVADMVYNHRDGGRPENNPAVKEYMLNYAGANNGSCNYGDNNTTQTTTYKQPFPSDRVRMVVPVGGSTGLGAGHYYININSRSGGYVGQRYLLYITTNKAGGGSAWDFANGCSASSSATSVNAPNGTYPASLRQGYWVEMNNNKTEFDLNLQAADFNADGDSLFIQAVNLCGNYTDHRIWKIWYGAGNYDIADQGAQNGTNYKLLFQTYTDFTGLPSKRGGLNWNAFRPNWNAQNIAATNGSGYHDTSKGGYGFGGATGTCLGPAWSQQSMDYFNDYDHSQSSGRDTLIAWTKWAYDQLGSKGLRMDAVKHFDPKFVADMLSSMYNSGRVPNLVVGEWYGENLNELQGWVNNVSTHLNLLNPSAASAIPVKVFDFSLRRALKDAIDNGANARQVYFSGLRDGKGMSGFNIVTFLNNHDFRSSNQSYGDALVHTNPILGYAYLLTNNQLGVPSVFYPDYYGYPARNTTFGSDTYPFDYHPAGLSPMKKEIDQLMLVLKKYITGAQGVSYLNHYGGTGNAPASPTNFISGDYNRCLIYQLNGTGAAGGKDVIVAINFDSNPLKVDHAIATQNGIGNGTRFLDVLGRSAFPFGVVDGQNRMYIELPAKSYSVWVRDATPLSATLASAPANGTICPGQSATLTINAVGGTAPYSYSFSSNATATGSSSVVSATASGTYSVTVTDALGLTTIASVVIAQYSVSSLVVSNNTPICAGTPVSLSATTGFSSYTFSGNSMTTSDSSPVLSLTLTAGTYAYTVTATDANGCTAISNASSVTVNALPVTSLSAVGSGLITCAGPATLVASGASSYTLAGPDNYSLAQNTTDFIVTSAGVYTLTGQNTAACLTSATLTVSADQGAPTVSISPSALTLTCASPTASLSVNGTGNIRWDNASTDITRTVSTSGTYSVTLTAANGCTNTASLTVSADQGAPTVSISPSALTLTCASPTASLSVNGTGNIRWDNATTDITRTVSTSGTYSVTLTAANGCTNTASIQVAEDKTPPVAGISGSTSLCTGQSITLTATGSGTYRWEDNSTSPTRTVSPSAGTTYSVTLTGTNGCTATANQSVSVTAPPVVSITPATITVAAGQNVTLSAATANSYLWSTQAMTPQISVSSATAGSATYSVTGTSSGCSATATATVSYTGTPPCNRAAALQVSQSGWMCNGSGLVSLSATGPGSYTLTGPGGTQPMPGGIATVSQAGTYTIATLNGGCLETSTITVAPTTQSPVVSSLTLSSPLTSNTCAVKITGLATGTNFVFRGPNDYVFSNVYRVPVSTTAFALNVRKPGTYWLTTYLGGCSVTNSIVVTGTACP